jgi:hypothetical protein
MDKLPTTVTFDGDARFTLGKRQEKREKKTPVVITLYSIKSACDLIWAAKKRKLVGAWS